MRHERLYEAQARHTLVRLSEKSAMRPRLQQAATCGRARLLFASTACQSQVCQEAQALTATAAGHPVWSPNMGTTQLASKHLHR